MHFDFHNKLLQQVLLINCFSNKPHLILCVFFHTQRRILRLLFRLLWHKPLHNRVWFSNIIVDHNMRHRLRSKH